MSTVYVYRDIVEFGPSEPTPYVERQVVVYKAATSTPADVFLDSGLTSPASGGTLTTNRFGELLFYSLEPTVDLVRLVGGRRTTYTGEPLGSGQDYFAYARGFFLG